MKNLSGLILLITITTFSCNFKDEHMINILALGDSYTIGESVSENERWPVQLASELRRSGFNINSPEIIAKTGWTTDELLSALNEAELLDSYELVTLLIGVNNQYRRRDTANYRMELEQLLNKAVSLAGNKAEQVLMISIPDWGVTPFALKQGRENISAEIDVFNRIKRELAEQNNITFIDITEISRNAAYQPDLIAADGLHPSAKMYTEWLNKILPPAKKALVYN